jgi:hypothetical protein
MKNAKSQSSPPFHIDKSLKTTSNNRAKHGA